jgi:hypothetical protein
MIGESVQPHSRGEFRASVDTSTRMEGGMVRPSAAAVLLFTAEWHLASPRVRICRNAA